MRREDDGQVIEISNDWLDQFGLGRHTFKSTGNVLFFERTRHSHIPSSDANRKGVLIESCLCHLLLQISGREGLKEHDVGMDLVILVR